jgi:phage FluMu protein Com
MADIRFRCDGCTAKLVIDSSAAGLVINCPHCKKELRVPALSHAPANSRGMLSEEEIDFLSAAGKIAKRTRKAHAGSGLA